MASIRFFLDTNALMCLSGLEDLNLQDFRTKLKSTNSELNIIHVAIDEKTNHIKFREPVKEKRDKKVQTYQQKIAEGLKKLQSKGIHVRVEACKIPVVGISRAGYFMVGDKEIGEFYDELRKEIDACERAKDRAKDVLNIARDATTAVSSLDHDFFITCDRCLYESWQKIIGKHRKPLQNFAIPQIILAKRHPNGVAEAILNLLF